METLATFKAKPAPVSDALDLSPWKVKVSPPTAWRMIVSARETLVKLTAAVLAVVKVKPAPLMTV